MLLPESSQRRQLLHRATELIDNYYQGLRDSGVAPVVDSATVRATLSAHDFESPQAAEEALQWVFEAMRDWGMKVAHPGYYGLFNPAPSFAGVLADLLVAALNPQVGAWHHHPFGVEMERHLVKYFADRFGLEQKNAFGHFTSGGSEANTTAVLVALTRQFESFGQTGLRGLPGQPVFYCSAEFHHSFEKIAHQCGLGRQALRKVPIDEDYRLSVRALESMIARDHDTGNLPFMVVATAGTTNAGIIDPLSDIAALCRREQLHLHVDAAWGGGIVLCDELRPLLTGIEQADSLTFDPHKLLSVPMAAGMFICRQARWLADTFHVETAYVPESATIGLDNYRLSLQFSRRLIGLKLFLTLLIHGRQGYAETIGRQIQLSEQMAQRLQSQGWRVVNGPSLGIVCFEEDDDGGLSPEQRAAGQQQIVSRVVASGRAWISVTRLGQRPVIRACVTSHLTRLQDVDELIQLLNAAR